jgi:hypothetical protein
MTELAPCPRCKRHVATRETACPFCAHRFTPRGQHIALVGRVSRAAVFSAALAACSNDKAPAPAPPPSQGSDDLEKLLDNDGKAVEHPTAPVPIDAAVAEPDAAIVDAGAPPDAGVAIKKKKKQQEKVEVATPPPDDRIINAKPYGAPPARRRVV